MAGGKTPLTFRLYKGDEFLREEKLALPVIKVGKLSSSHLRLEDKNVSRMHALIEVTGPGDVSIIDLSSTSGTPSSMRNAEELSTTTAPAATACGANSREIPPPALKSAISTPVKESGVSSFTAIA